MPRCRVAILSNQIFIMGSNGANLNGRLPKFLPKNIVVAELNRHRLLWESGQLLENGDRTHQLLASGKLVLIKFLTKGD